MSFLGLYFGSLLVGHVPYCSDQVLSTVRACLSPGDILLISDPRFTHAFVLTCVYLLMQVVFVALTFDLIMDSFILPPLRFRVLRWKRNCRRRRRAVLRLAAGSGLA